MSCWQMLTNFCLMTNLEQSGSWIPDARSVKFTFSLIVTFILQKLEIDLNNFYHSSHTIAFSKGAVFFQKILIFCKKKLPSAKLKESQQLKLYFLKLHIYVYSITYSISGFQLNSNKFQMGQFYHPHPLQNEPLKSLLRLELRCKIFTT